MVTSKQSDPEVTDSLKMPLMLTFLPLDTGGFNIEMTRSSDPLPRKGSHYTRDCCRIQRFAGWLAQICDVNPHMRTFWWYFELKILRMRKFSSQICANQPAKEWEETPPPSSHQSLTTLPKNENMRMQMSQAHLPFLAGLV